MLLLTNNCFERSISFRSNHNLLFLFTVTFRPCNGDDNNTKIFLYGQIYSQNNDKVNSITLILANIHNFEATGRPFRREKICANINI